MDTILFIVALVAMLLHIVAWLVLPAGQRVVTHGTVEQAATAGARRAAYQN